MVSTPQLSRRTFGTATALSALSVPVLAGCTSGATAGSEEADTTILTVGFPGDSENWDPHQPPQTVTRAVARQIADTLVDQDTESGEIVGWLAEDWEINEDKIGRAHV